MPTSCDSGLDARIRAWRSPMRPQPTSTVRNWVPGVCVRLIPRGYLITWISLRLLKLLISAGEASGDQHGARLLSALRKKRPDLTAFGMGGPRLQAAGLSLVVSSEALSVVGISEVLEKLPSLARAGRALAEHARRERPDAAILIDFPDFHGLLARQLRRLGIPLIYYV